MTTTITLQIDATRYEDHDDCLAAAAADSFGRADGMIAAMRAVDPKPNTETPTPETAERSEDHA